MSNFKSMFATAEGVVQYADAPDTQKLFNTFIPPEGGNGENLPATAGSTDPRVQASLNELRGMNMMEISKFGSKNSAELLKLSDEVNAQVKIGDTDFFGDGIKEILVLTGTVDIDALNMEEQPSGLINRLKHKFKKTKIEIIADYETTTTKINEIADTMRDGIVRLEKSYDWYERMKAATLASIEGMKVDIQACEINIAEETGKLEVVKQEPSNTNTIMRIQQQQALIDRKSKHADKLRKLLTMSDLKLMTLSGLQAGAVNQQIKFNDLIEITLPFWSQTMATSLQAMRLKKDAELSNKMDDTTNALMQKAATMTAGTMVNIAKNSQRSVFDLASVKHCQDTFVASLKEIKVIEEQGRKDRETSALELSRMHDQLRLEMSA